MEIRFLIVVGFLACVLFSFLAALLMHCARWEPLRSRAPYPPISDDEFMALCPPGTNRDIALRVRRIVSEQLGVNYDQVHPSFHFVDDLEDY